MRRKLENKVFKLAMATGRGTLSSKKEREREGEREGGRESDVMTGKAERWRSWRRGRGGARESCSEDFN